MDKPRITIDGAEIIIGPVKAKIWREAAKLKDLPPDEIISPEAMIDFIVKAFSDSRVTVESVEKNLNLEEVYPMFLKTYGYVLELVTAGLAGANVGKKNEGNI